MSDPVALTFRCDEALADRLRRTAFSLDITASDLIRACLRVGLSVIEDNPGIAGIGSLSRQNDAPRSPEKS